MKLFKQVLVEVIQSRYKEVDGKEFDEWSDHSKGEWVLTNVKLDCSWKVGDIVKFHDLGVVEGYYGYSETEYRAVVILIND